MTMFELSNVVDDVTRLIKADEIDTITGDNESGGLVVYLNSGEIIHFDYISQKEVEE